MPKALHPLNIVVRPLITEKATRLGGEHQYAFEVRSGANKVQVKEAVEKTFEVHVRNVNVMNMKGKPRRSRRGAISYKPDWKKAIVTLAPGDKIELFEGV